MESINKEHVNSKYVSALSEPDARRYMKNVKLPNNLKATSSLTKETYHANHVLLFAIPTEHLRSTLTSMKPLMKSDHLIILANKVRLATTFHPVLKFNVLGH